MTEETFTLTEHTYYQPDPNRPAVFVGGKGDKVPMSTAIAVGLVKKASKPASKPEEVVETKAVTSGEVENKAVTPTAKKPSKPATPAPTE